MFTIKLIKALDDKSVIKKTCDDYLVCHFNIKVFIRKGSHVNPRNIQDMNSNE